MKKVIWSILACACLAESPIALGQANPAGQTQPVAAKNLTEFGPIGTPQQVQETYRTAVKALRERGGVLVVPREVFSQTGFASLQGLTRTPPPPVETKNWREGAGVTVISGTEDSVVIQVPPLTGMRIERRLNLEDRDSVPHWGTHPMLTIESRLVYGSSSYLDWIQEPVAKGADRRFYLPTVRGLRPGQFLNIHGGPHYGGGVTRAYVKSLGYDAEKRMHYLVADSEIDHVAGAIAHNKSNTGLVHMLQNSHADNQTYDMKIIRNQYAHGDTYMFYADFNYMSNVHSAAGDENGNVFGAFIRSEEDNFQGTVEGVDWNQQRLTFTPDSRNVHTLGDSRPLINRNPQKAITAGKVLIVPSKSEFSHSDNARLTFEGKLYPTQVVTHPVTGNRELDFGGLIRGSADCPWTADVVGRFFTLTESTEKTPRGSHRWYYITAFRANADGTKEIEIRRYWWGAKSAGGPMLYREENYTWDGHLRPLSYAIAPGTYVNDVSRAVPGGDRGGQRQLGLAPFRDQGTPLDFAAGDALEQAIGPDPFKPQAFRVWMWEDVPGQFPAAVFDLANYGGTSRYSAMSIHGDEGSLAEAAKRHDGKPAWDNILVVNSSAGVGLNLKADFADAAILFQQPHAEQPVKWHYGHQEGAAPKVAALTVSKTSGELNFSGGGVRTNGPVSAVQGISGDDKPARNLRGKNVAIAQGETSLRVKFPAPEADGDYAVFLEQSWLGQRAISDKTAEGFTVAFDKPAPAKATVDWMLLR